MLKSIDINAARNSIKRLEVLTEKLNEQDAREKLISGITKDIPTPIWAKDLYSRFAFVNKACCDLILRCTEEEAMNMKDSDLKDNTFARVCMASDRLTEERMQTCRFIEHATTDNGENMWIVSTKSPWIKNKTLLGTVGTADNITSIVPDDIKEKFRNGDFFEINLDTVICESVIRDLFK